MVVEFGLVIFSLLTAFAFAPCECGVMKAAKWTLLAKWPRGMCKQCATVDIDFDDPLECDSWLHIFTISYEYAAMTSNESNGNSSLGCGYIRFLSSQLRIATVTRIGHSFIQIGQSNDGQWAPVVISTFCVPISMLREHRLEASTQKKYTQSERG